MACTDSTEGKYYVACGDATCTKPVCLLDLLKDLDLLIKQPESIDIPGLFSFDLTTGRFAVTLHDEGVPYGEIESKKMLAVTEFTIPLENTQEAAARFVPITHHRFVSQDL